MQNFGQFYKTSSAFDREYFGKQSRNNRKDMWSRTIPPAFSQRSELGPVSIK